MTTNSTSRQSVKATTGLRATAVGGLPVERRGRKREIGLTPSIRFLRWMSAARLKHLLGKHAWVDTERWEVVDGVRTFSVIGQECWLCPARR